MLAIKGGKILTITKGIIKNGTILINNGKIEAIGKNINIPKGVKVISAEDKIVMPGMIDAHSHLGGHGEGVGSVVQDFNEYTNPITAHLRGLDAINPNEMGFRMALEAGVTTVLTGPGSANLMGGQCVVLKTFGKTVNDMVILEPAGLKMALGENPKNVHGSSGRTPATRMGAAGLIRKTFIKAQNYIKKWEKYYSESATSDSKESKPKDEPERDLDMEVVAKVLKREMKARIHSHRADDILTAIRIAEEFNLNITIEHGTEAYTIPEELAKRNIPVVCGPFLDTIIKHECRLKTLAAPGILAKAGVKVAISMDGASDTRFLPICAGLCVREGMDEEEALKAVTINPAEIIDVANRVGSLEVGKDADILILSGHPFETFTKVEKVILNGNVVYER